MVNDLSTITRSDIYNRVDKLENRLEGSGNTGVITIKGTYLGVDLEIYDKQYMGFVDRAFIKDKEGNIKDKVKCPTMCHIYDVIDRASIIDNLRIKGHCSELLVIMSMDFERIIDDLKEGIKKGSKVNTLTLMGDYCTVKVVIDLNSRARRYRLTILDCGDLVMDSYIGIKYDLVKAYKRVRNMELSYMLRDENSGIDK